MMYFHPSTETLLARLGNDLPQGLLLQGEPGIGLLTFARAAAREYTKEIIVVAPDEKGTITINRVRDLYALARNKSAKTVFIVDDADRMGVEAQNAFLKLLEEPVAGVRFILTTHRPDLLLPTIRSRVQASTLRPTSSAQDGALLDDLRVTDPTKRSQLLFIAGGYPAALTRYATTNKLFNERATIVRDARAFLGGSREDRLLLAAGYKDRTAALALARDMARLLQRTIGANPRPGSTDPLDAILDAEDALEENASVRLTLTRLSLLL